MLSVIATDLLCHFALSELNMASILPQIETLAVWCSAVMARILQCGMVMAKILRQSMVMAKILQAQHSDGQNLAGAAW